MNLMLPIILSLLPFTSLTTEINEDDEVIVDTKLNDRVSYKEDIKGNNIEIYVDNRKLLTIGDNEKVYCANNNVYIFSLENNELSITQYSYSKEITILDYKKEANNFYLIDNYLLLENNGDIEIIELDEELKEINSRRLIGKGIETIHNVLKFNSQLCLLIEKEELSGGDYGNGGMNGKGICLLVLNERLETTKILTFDSEMIINLEVVEKNEEPLENDRILVITLNNAFYAYDSDLNQIIGLKFHSNCIFGKTMINKIGVFYHTRFMKNGIEVIDLNEGKIVYSSGFDEINDDISNIKEIDDSYYLYNQSAKLVGKTNIYYIKDFKIENVYYDNSDKPANINDHIYSLNKRINLTKVRTIGDFDSNIAGTYLTYYFYDDLELSNKTYNYPSINIKDGLIYPINYCIVSNMEMTLNGEKINNNYLLDKDGDYVLELIMDGNYYKSINFKVDSSMCKIENNTYNTLQYEYYLNVKEYIRLEYNYKLEENEEVESIIINDTEIKDFDTFDNNGLLGIFVYLECLNEGINEYNVECIKIKGDKINHFININDHYILYGLSERINYETVLEEKDDSITINTIFSNSESLRCFYVSYYNNDNLLLTTYLAYKNQKIGIIKNCTKVEIGLVSDINYTNLILNSLITLKYSDIDKNDYFNINILNKEEVLKEFEIDVNKTNNLESLEANNEVLFSNTIYNYTLIVIGSIIVGIIGIIIDIIILRRKGILIRNK